LVNASCDSPGLTPTETTGIPNPASVYPGQNGEKMESRENETGVEFDFCIFLDGSQCKD